MSNRAKYRVRKMLVIGLGGTGRDAVLNVKRKYREAYGTDAIPTTEFLVFDTADQRPLDLREGAPLALKPGEFFKMTVANPQLVVEVNSEVSRWFPREDVPMRSITRGAGQVRAVGRLALYHNAAEVFRRIKGALDRLNSLKPHEPLGEFHPVNDSILINVVGSLSGGTGSGTFLDVAYVCRHHMRPSLDLLVGYLLLPDVFVDRPGTENVEPNAYAAMKEMDMLMGQTLETAGESFMFGGEQISMASHPFDIVYLVNNRNKRGQVFQEVGELTELLGMGIFVASGATGQNAGDVWDNLQFQIRPADAYHGKSPHYASFGVAELVFNAERYVEEQKNRIAARAVESLLRAPEAGAAESADPEDAAAQTVGSVGLASLDQLLTRLDPERKLAPFRKTTGGSLRRWDDDFTAKDTHVRREEARVRERLEGTVAPVLQHADSLLRERARAFAAEPYGLHRALAFVQRARGALDEQRAAAVTQRESARSARGATAQRLAQQLGEFRQRQEGLGALLRRRSLRRAAENIEQVINQEAEQAAAVVRFDAAATLLAGLVLTCDQLVAALQDLLLRLGTIGGQLRSLGAEAEQSGRPIRPFTIELPFPEFLKDDQEIDPGELLQWLRTARVDLFDLRAKTDGELTEFFRDFADERPSVRKIRSQSLEELLATNVYDLREQVRLLDSVAEPLWLYETAYLNGGRGTHTIYVFGVPRDDQTVFQSDEVASMLATSSFIQPATTNDPNRVFCYKVEAAVPGFVLERMARYKYRYAGRPSLYHADRDWGDRAPDLWPNGTAQSGPGAVHLGPDAKVVANAEPAGQEARDAAPPTEPDAEPRQGTSAPNP